MEVSEEDSVEAPEADLADFPAEAAVLEDFRGVAALLEAAAPAEAGKFIPHFPCRYFILLVL